MNDSSTHREETADVGAELRRLRGENERLAAELKEARELLQADRRKDEFLAMLGHELRNPLAPIVTAVKLMELKGGDAMRRERQVIERQVKHLIRLVDDLLDVSRIAQGKIELSRTRVDLADAVARAVELASPIFEGKQQSLAIDVPRGALFVDGDAVRLAQVFANLLTNAGKYTQARGHIELRAAREGAFAVLRVKDDGQGISPELLPRVFDLFVQGTQSLHRAEGGLGLGLAVARNLVQLHGGQISASSPGANQGSELLVRLPLLEPSPRAELSPAGGAVRGASGLRVLVVDDNIDAASSLAEALTLLGHQASVAHDGPEALARLESFHADVGVLDLGLPVMDGFELALRMRKLPGGPRKLIALTGYGQPEDRRRTQAAGFDAHLVKPVDLLELNGIVLKLAGARPT